MIYVTSDLHGGSLAYHITSARFRPAKRGDIVLVCGDFGAVWWHDVDSNPSHRRLEERFLDTILRKRVLWLAVDGNHENFARLFGEFPIVQIFGGRAYQIRDNIYYLKRGEVFTIMGKTFFAFGGATSFDRFPVKIKSLGWDGGYDITPGRKEGIDWWPEEVPSAEDLDNAYRNLERIGWQVDHVITHTCPASQRRNFFSGETADPTEQMLQELYEKLIFKSWHFGHFHMSRQVGKFYCHFNEVVPLPGHEPL